MNSFQKDYEAYNLAKYFLNSYRKYSFKIFKLNNVKNTKWWKFFVETIEKYGEEKNWDAKKYIEVNFEEHGKILPFFLPGKKAFETFQNHMKRGERNVDEAVAKDLLLSYKIVNDWCKKNNAEFSNEEFISNYVNQLKFKRKELSTYYVVISKSLFNFLQERVRRELNINLDKQKVLNKRAVIFNNKKITEKMKEILKDDFMDNLNEVIKN